VTWVDGAPDAPHGGPDLVRGGRLALRAVIVLLVLFTAAAHAYFVFQPEEPLWVRVSFSGVTLGYLVLLAAMYVPPSTALDLRLTARWLLMALAFVVIVGYFVVGAFDTLGNVTKGVEVALVLLLVVEEFL
jgi:hypothetical protein